MLVDDVTLSCTDKHVHKFTSYISYEIPWNIATNSIASMGKQMVLRFDSEPDRDGEKNTEKMAQYLWRQNQSFVVISNAIYGVSFI